MKAFRRFVVGLLAVALVVMTIWAMAIGPVAVWRVLTHGTTTVWDHLEYPGREIGASPSAHTWPEATRPFTPPSVSVGGREVGLEGLLGEHDTLAFLVVDDGELAYEWYAPSHPADRPSMTFSVTKSILSLMVGAAIDDGLIRSVDDPVATYLPELADRGFESVTLKQLLRMDSSLDYVEDDNPFGTHVEFNYTADLTGDILGLRILEQPDSEFRYKSGDYAVLGLVLDRVLGDRSITDYLQERLWDPLGSENGGVWSTDHEGGLERTWCCLAVTARDLARFGVLALGDGDWQGRQLLPGSWLETSMQSGFDADRWPEDYERSAIVNYGYGWWLTGDAWVALGKGGQYLYIDPERRSVIVRLGETSGDLGWLDILRQVALAAG